MNSDAIERALEAARGRDHAAPTGAIDGFDDATLAHRLAYETGQFLLHLRNTWCHPELPFDALGRAGDVMAHESLMRALRRSRPWDGVLSEEAVDDRKRLGARRVWIIDPLDGSREFSERGRCDWAVHVALTIDGHVTEGAVALPATGTVVSTAAPVRHRATGHRWPRIVVSRTRPPAEAASLCDALGAELVPMGSAGAKTVAVITGDAEVYLHSGGQHEWDLAAPTAAALAAGLHVSRLDGSQLRFNRPDTWVPDVLICTPRLASVVLELLADVDPAPVPRKRRPKSRHWPSASYSGGEPRR
jgi:3'(2'), 5'-bisphosphate nucleotidase